MDYEKRHKEEVVRATQLWECGDITRENLEYIFPELTESEDEKIRNQIINFIEEYGNPIHCEWQKKWIAWLEKQGDKAQGKSAWGDEEYNGEDYGIDGLWHAHRILEKTLGKVDGYQSDDGILEHKCAISAVKKLYEQKPAWSEEDELIALNIEHVMNCASLLNIVPEKVDKIRTWIKSLKQRMEG